MAWGGCSIPSAWGVCHSGGSSRSTSPTSPPCDKCKYNHKLLQRSNLCLIVCPAIHTKTQPPLDSRHTHGNDRITVRVDYSCLPVLSFPRKGLSQLPHPHPHFRDGMMTVFSLSYTSSQNNTIPGWFGGAQGQDQESEPPPSETRKTWWTCFKPKGLRGPRKEFLRKQRVHTPFCYVTMTVPEAQAA